MRFLSAILFACLVAVALADIGLEEVFEIDEPAYHPRMQNKGSIISKPKPKPHPKTPEQKARETCVDISKNCSMQLVLRMCGEVSQAARNVQSECHRSCCIASYNYAASSCQDCKSIGVMPQGF